MFTDHADSEKLKHIYSQMFNIFQYHSTISDVEDIFHTLDDIHNDLLLSLPTNYHTDANAAFDEYTDIAFMNRPVLHMLAAHLRSNDTQINVLATDITKTPAPTKRKTLA